jgi:hypothetical protein
MKVTPLIKIIILLLFIPLLIQSVQANIENEINLYSDEIEDFIGDKTAVIFIGEYASSTEKISFGHLQNTHSKVKDAIIYENPNEINNLDLSDKVIVLIGGSNRNSLSKELLNKENEISVRDLTAGSIRYITTPESQKYIIFSDAKSEATIPNTSIKRSPLKGIIPDEYIPAVAVLAGLSLLWLWQIISVLFMKISRLFVSGMILSKVKKKNVKEEFKGFYIRGLRIKYRELFAVVISATIFALAITYTYFEKEIWILLVATNVIVNSLVYITRNLVRLYLDKIHKLHTEYVFWIWGAIVTVLTGWLGYTLSMAGYVQKHDSEINVQEGKIQFIINLFTFIFAIIFFVLNFVFDHIIFQMAGILSITIAFIQMMPFKPFSGLMIFKWRKLAWFLLFVPMIITYVVINLI